MARPPIERSVAGVPRITLFKPAGIPARELEQTSLTVDELEAMRLVDLEALSHEQAAEVMGVSRQTVGRVLERGRASVVEALVAGKAILIGGGQYRVQPQQRRCFACGSLWTNAPDEAHTTTCPACGSDDIGLCWGSGQHCGRRHGGRGGRGGGPHGPGCAGSAERRGGRGGGRRGGRGPHAAGGTPSAGPADKD
jgi:uncharacterized protein